MAKIKTKEETSVAIEKVWNYWKSVRNARSFYLNDGFNTSEFLMVLWAAKQAISQQSGSNQKSKHCWNDYVEHVLKGNETVQYIDQYLSAYEKSGFKVPTKEMVEAASKTEEIKKEAKIIPKEMKPVAIEINKNLDPNWNYWDSVKKVRRLYLKWSSISSKILRELYIAKQAITKGGTRKSGLPKKGEMSWNRYVEEAFGGMVSKRTIDSHLLAYENNGCQKPEKLTVNAISDHSKVVIKSAVRLADGRIEVEVYLPEFDTTYFPCFEE